MKLNFKNSSREGGRRAETSAPESDKELPILYVKSGCLWCVEVVDFLMGHGIGFREKNVSEHMAAFAEMKEKSGQTRAPTLDWHGKILADFGVEELKPFLREQNVKFEDS
jgi:glutaredoxin 3